jgi:hypothetical protein
MLKEGMEEVRTAVFGHPGVGDFIREVLDMLGEEVGHCPILGVAPTVLDRIECRRICRSGLARDAGAINRPEEARGCAMPTPAIPDDEPRALAGPVELLDKDKDIVAGAMVRSEGTIEAEALAHWRESNGAGHRKAVVAVSALMDRCLAL